MRRWTGPVVALVAGILAVVLCWCHAARAVTFEQHKPNYIITNYSSEHPDSTNNPWLECQVSIRLPLMEAVGDEHKLTLPYFPDGNPVLAFSIHAWWRVADESSPFEELDWNPQAFYSMFADNKKPLVAGATLDGVNVGWEHVSTGVSGLDSRGWDRVVAEGKVGWKALVLYVRPWAVFNYDQFTEDIASVVNFGDSDYGGETILKLVTNDITLAATAGLGYQDYEVTIPLRDVWNIALYGQLHNGKNESLETYDKDTTSGGAGIVLKR